MDSSIEGREGSSESQLAGLLSAAGDPTRLRILALLRHRECSVREICQALDSAQPRVSHHLSILRRSGLLEVEVKGRQRIYRWPREAHGSSAEDLGSFLTRWLGPAGSAVSPEGEAGAPGTDDAQASKRIEDDLEDFLL